MFALDFGLSKVTLYRLKLALWLGASACIISAVSADETTIAQALNEFSTPEGEAKSVNYFNAKQGELCRQLEMYSKYCLKLIGEQLFNGRVCTDPSNCPPLPGSPVESGSIFCQVERYLRSIAEQVNPEARGSCGL